MRNMIGQHLFFSSLILEVWNWELSIKFQPSPGKVGIKKAHESKDNTGIETSGLQSAENRNRIFVKDRSDRGEILSFSLHLSCPLLTSFLFASLGPIFSYITWRMHPNQNGRFFKKVFILKYFVTFSEGKWVKFCCMDAIDWLIALWLTSDEGPR